MYRVEIKYCGQWYPLAVFASRDDAEWSIAVWMSENTHGSKSYNSIRAAYVVPSVDLVNPEQDTGCVE